MSEEQGYRYLHKAKTKHCHDPNFEILSHVQLPYERHWKQKNIEVGRNVKSAAPVGKNSMNIVRRTMTLKERVPYFRDWLAPKDREEVGDDIEYSDSGNASPDQACANSADPKDASVCQQNAVLYSNKHDAVDHLSDELNLDYP